MTLIPILTGGGGNFVATGGTIYTQGGYRYHKFTSSGNFTVQRGSKTLEYLVVAGGGSGGNTNGDTSAPAQIAKGGNGDGPGNNGAANTGNGGNGARSANNALQSPGNGGSGIVIIRYAV